MESCINKQDPSFEIMARDIRAAIVVLNRHNLLHEWKEERAKQDRAPLEQEFFRHGWREIGEEA